MQFPEINFSVLPPYSLTFIYGQRVMGKSTLIKDHVKQIVKSREIDNIYVFSKIDKEIYEELNPSILSEFNNDHFDDIKLEQMEKIKNNSIAESIIILDEIYKNSDPLKELIFKSRKLGLTVFIATETMYLWKPEIIARFDYCFFARVSDYNNW